ncbi:MAG TPA: hypothetical protein O0X97_04725 [Methanocorpusculum sp.]|nr:hypothetical protein [Methanocorpusculum sp.]
MNGAVFKFGGSLADAAGKVLDALEKAEVPALIVPGGGVFADAVRKDNPDDDTAHWRAIAAMNRYGVFLSSFGFPVTEDMKMPNEGISILLPEHVMKTEDPLPHSWDVTSDSIALWIADKIHAPLVLLKSREGEFGDTSYIDTYFSALKKSSDTAVTAVNARDRDELSAFLRENQAAHL